MKLLLSGSPVSSQLHIAFARELLACAGRSDVLILVPTATMADHYRHSLVRLGIPLRPKLRPKSIQTMAQFLDVWSPMGAAPVPLVQFLLGRALERQNPDRFRRVAQDAGFLSGLTRLFAEASFAKLLLAAQRVGGGEEGEDGANQSSASDVARLFREVEAKLAARKLAPRHARLVAAANRIGQGESASLLPVSVLVDGFAKFSAGEIALLSALAGRTQESAAVSATTAVALPVWFGAEGARRKLLAQGFVERDVRVSTDGQNSRVMFTALNIEREVEEIARRILAYVQAGRLFREIGIIVRARNPYGPLLETTLARFGIPVRSYFTDPVARHPAAMYWIALMRSLLSGWDQASLLSALRMPVSGFGATPAGDAFDFALRLRLPDVGLPVPAPPEGGEKTRPGSKGHEKPVAQLPPHVLAQLQDLTARRREWLSPAAWAERLRALRTLIPMPDVADHADADHVRMWRSTATALHALDDAFTSAADALTPVREACDLKTFWSQVETVLSLEPLRVPDLRRNVVHLLDAFEARQWELPVTFVCGMTERHFPQYHSENPIIGDDVLRRAGLDTAADHEQEEQFLFAVATTRASVETVLSYPKFSESGEPTLPSFLLQSQLLEGMTVEECGGQVRPGVTLAVHGVRGARFAEPVIDIQDSALLQQLSSSHKTLSPTSIESFLQCSFQFFAKKTLRLRERPPAPRERLNMLLQGNIMHRALNEWLQKPLLGAAILDQVFEDECSKHRVPSGYRKEAVRLELLRNFEAFLEDRRVSPSGSQRGEALFTIPLTDGLSITGRIDRIDIDAQQRALVIDYKYSAGAKIRDHVGNSEAGNLAQSGLYMLAAKEFFGLEPMGMLFCGLKKGVNWDGWHVAAPGLEAVGTACTPDVLEAMMQQARRKALEVHEAVLSGRIAPKPADAAKCVWCDVKDVCRIETVRAEVFQIAAVRSAAAGAALPVPPEDVP